MHNLNFCEVPTRQCRSVVKRAFCNSFEPFLRGPHCRSLGDGEAGRSLSREMRCEKRSIFDGIEFLGSTRHMKTENERFRITLHLLLSSYVFKNQLSKKCESFFWVDRTSTDESSILGLHRTLIFKVRQSQYICRTLVWPELRPIVTLPTSATTQYYWRRGIYAFY